MKKSFIMKAVFVTGIFLLSMGMTMAYFTDKAEKTNVMAMGNIKIRLDEPNYRPGKDGMTQGLSPGDEVIKDPTITVLKDSESCYLKAMLTYNGLSPEQIAQMEQGLDISKEWVKGEREEHTWYYQKAVLKEEKDQPVVFFTKVKIPPEWGNEMREKVYTISVQAKAIQSEYFKPQTNSRGEIIAWEE